MGGSRAEVRWDAARGVWYARPYLGVNRVTGRPVRPYRSFPGARGREEAQEMCDRWAAGLVPEIGLHVGRTVPEIAEAYVDHLSASGAAASTVRSYRSVVRAQIAPVLSGVDVDELRPYAVEGFYAALMSPSRAGGGVGASTVLKTHWLLSGMYRWAVRIGAASANPMPSVGAPRRVPHEAEALGEDDMRRVDGALREAMSDPSASHAAVFRRNAAMAAFLSLRLGVRCGEALALTRSRTVGRRGGRSVRVDATAVELPGGPVLQPRTKGGRGRTLSVTEAVGAEMRAHVAWQDSTYLPRASGATPLCCLESGAVMRPSKASAWFSRLRDDLGLPPGTSFHTLRHTHATWLLYQGVDVRTVSERLGHAKVSTTLELYAHVLPGRDATAAEAFDEAVGGGRGA